VKVKGGTHIQWPVRYTAMSGNGAVKGVDPAAPVTSAWATAGPPRSRAGNSTSAPRKSTGRSAWRTSEKRRSYLS
jgi:hypothetical protein